MSVFAAELKRVCQPVRMLVVLCVFLLVALFFLPRIAWDHEVQLAADASAAIARLYGTHLDAEERSRMEDELFAQSKENIRLRMDACEAFVEAGVKTYEDYCFLRYDKTRLAVMTQEEKNAMSDEHFFLNYGVGKDYDATLSEAEITLLELSDANAGEVGEILYECLVFQRIEDWVTFWYDDRQRLASFTENAENAYEAQALQKYVQAENYYGNMPYEVSESVSKCVGAVTVAALFSVMLLCSLSPAVDRVTKTDILQTVTKKGKIVLLQQCKVSVFCAAVISICSVAVSFGFLLMHIPSVLWNCPVNSYQSFFTIYHFNGTLLQYFLLCVVLQVLLIFVCSLFAFASSLTAKNYTVLLGLLLPLLVVTEWLANLLLRIPFSAKQSLHGPLYFSDLIAFPMAEIPLCVLLFVAALFVSLLAVQKRKKELADYL